MDRTQYNTTRFNPILLRRYHTWLEGGRKPLSAEELDDIFENAAAELQAQNESNMEPAKTSNGEIKITHEGMNI